MKVIIMSSWRTEALQKSINTFIANKDIIDIKYTAINSEKLEKAEYSAMIIYR